MGCWENGMIVFWENGILGNGFLGKWYFGRMGQLGMYQGVMGREIRAALNELKKSKGNINT